MTITFRTLDGGTTIVPAAELETLRSTVRGDLILADSPFYDAARRVWNGNVDRRPALVLRCTGPADVQRAVDFVRTCGLLVSVRGGGHSAPGYGTNDGGVVIDMSRMKGIQVDPARRIRARARRRALGGPGP
jgi:FAD/FMN-containing dehydrogenase